MNNSDKGTDLSRFLAENNEQIKTSAHTSDEHSEETSFKYFLIKASQYIFKESGKSKFAQSICKLSRRIGKANTLRTLCKSNLSKYKDKNRNRGFGMIAFKNFIDTVRQEQNKDASLEVATDEFMYLTKDDKIIKLKSRIKGTFIRWSIKDLSLEVQDGR